VLPGKPEQGFKVDTKDQGSKTKDERGKCISGKMLEKIKGLSLAILEVSNNNKNIWGQSKNSMK